MFDKMVMGKFYRKAKAPSDIPWHREEPEAFIVEVLKKRGNPGRALNARKSRLPGFKMICLHGSRQKNSI